MSKSVLADVPEQFRLSKFRDSHESRLLFLRYLYEEPGRAITNSGGISPADYAGILNVDPKAVSGALRDLQERGAIVRKVKGKRTKEISLSPWGVRIVEALWEVEAAQREPEPEQEPTVIDITDPPSITEPDEESGPSAEDVAAALLSKVLDRAYGDDVTMRQMRGTISRLEGELATFSQANINYAARIERLEARLREAAGELSEAQSIERSLRSQLGRANERVGELQGVVDTLQRQHRGGAGLKAEDIERLAEFKRTMEERPGA